MKKLQKIGLYAMSLVAFSATLLVEVGPQSFISSAFAQTGTGTGTGTGGIQIGHEKGIFTFFYTYDKDGNKIIDHVGYCCGSGNTICTPSNCP